jgi:hypothetical protein
VITDFGVAKSILNSKEILASIKENENINAQNSKEERIKFRYFERNDDLTRGYL